MYDSILLSKSCYYLDEKLLIASHCPGHTNIYFTSICTRPYVCPCGIWHVPVYLLSFILCTLSRCGLLSVSYVKKNSSLVQSPLSSKATLHPLLLLLVLLLLLSRSVVSDSVRPHRQQPTRLPFPGILQARILEWVAIFFSNTPIIICQIFTLQKSQRGTSEIQFKLFTSYIFSHKSVFLLGTFCIKIFTYVYICNSYGRDFGITNAGTVLVFNLVIFY